MGKRDNQVWDTMMRLVIWGKSAAGLRLLLSTFLCVLPAAVPASDEAGGAEALRVLILSGRNNHEWQKTTPLLEDLFGQSVRFGVVETTEAPGTLTAADLAGYDVLVSNWTPYPDTARLWPPETEQAFLDFVRKGGGFVVIHAAACTFQGWPEFQQINGLTWKDGYTGHTRYDTFQVSVEDQDHPIARGLTDFLITDELYQNMVQVAGHDLHTVWKAYSAPEIGGTGKDQPILVCTRFGEGRGVNFVLGHDVAAMGNLGFRTLLLRSAEWAATGEVTLPAPEAWATVRAQAAGNGGPYRWKEGGSATLMGDAGVIWQLNCELGVPKPCFHPLTVNGIGLTALSPPDHPWHRALWFAWKDVNGLNYWEEDRSTGLSQGRTEVTDVKATTNEDRSARIEMTLGYHPPEQPAVLTEERLLTVTAPGPDGGYSIDWTATFRAGAEDVALKGGTSGGGYAGLSVRVSPETKDWEILDSEGRKDVPVEFMAKNTHGQRARWMDFSVVDKATGRPAGIALMDHPGNLRHPAEWHNVLSDKIPFGYFSPAPLWSEPYTIAAGEELTLRYRIVVHAGRGDPERLDATWREFAGMTK